MTQDITVGYKQLCDEAEAEIETLTPEEAIEMARRDNVVMVDIRDVRELHHMGRVPGSFHCPRGMVEFWIDPESPYHKEIFSEDQAFIFHCAGGLRSALATQVAQRMGLKPVYNMGGGFGAWKKAGGEVEDYEK